MACLIRRLLPIVAAGVVFCFEPSSAAARARLIAVAPLRSTAQLSAAAAALDVELVARLSAIVGNDAKLLDSVARRSPVDAAAAIGATIYVAGQLTQDDATSNVTVTSFDVGTDHKIATQTFALAAGHVPASVDLGTLLGTPQTTASLTPARASIGAPILLVPFGMPNDKDAVLQFATTEFAKKMLAKGKVLVQAPVMDHVEATTDIPTLCSQYGASSVLIGTARHEQRLNHFFGSYPTHAEVLVTEINCSGIAVWKGLGTGDLVYYFANAGAAVSAAIDMALDTIVSQYVGRSKAPQPATPGAVK